jgi:hypothetical protein
MSVLVLFFKYHSDPWYMYAFSSTIICFQGLENRKFINSIDLNLRSKGCS